MSRSASATARPPRACAAGEDRQAREQPLLAGVEQVVGPLDRRAERPLARVGVSAAGEQVEAPREPLEDLRRRQDLRTGGGELDRERHVVEGAAERADGFVRLGEARAGDEQLDGVGLGERLDRVLDLASDAEALPARREDREVRARLDEVGERRRRLDHLLEVVEDEEHLALADVVGEAVLRAERLGDLVGDERRVADRRQLDPERAGLVVADELGGGLDRQARLARAAGAGERDEPRAVSRISATISATSRSRPTNELAGRGRFVFEIVFSGGKRSEPSWKIRTGSLEVLQAVLAEVEDASRRDPADRRVASESSTCPPWPAAPIRAPRWTSSPT